MRILQKTEKVRWLTLTNGVDGTRTAYTWDAKSHTLVCQTTGEPDPVDLAGASAETSTSISARPERAPAMSSFLPQMLPAA